MLDELAGVEWGGGAGPSDSDVVAERSDRLCAVDPDETRPAVEVEDPPGEP